MNMKKLIVLILFCAFAFISFTAVAAEKNKAKKAKKTLYNIEVQTKDDVILSGILVLPENANVKNKVPMVVLLHSLGSNRAAYSQLATDLKNKNIASLAIDSRGHGQSTTKLSGKKTYWQNYSNKIFQKYPDDIVATLDYISEHYVAVDTSRLGILGADVNANAAVVAAANGKYNIKTLVLVSPCIEFKGLQIYSSLVKYGNKPITMIVTQNDKFHYQNAKELQKYAQGQVNFITTKYGGTGDSIIKLNPYLNSVIADWFAKYL